MAMRPEPLIERPPVHGRIVRSGFRPHPLLRSAHLQTIWPTLLRRSPVLPLRIERLELADGDFVDLGWAGDGAGPIAVLVHGLGGTFDSKYLCGVGRQLVTAGWRVCALQLRGGSAESNRLPRNYHHGDSADLRELWQRLRQREPRVFLATIGWSLGGNLLLKALGEEGEHAGTDIACAVSVPFRLHECAEHLRHGFPRVYQRWLLDGCRVLVRRKQAAMPLPAAVNLAQALAARDFFEFDGAWTAPLNGFDDAADYYARSACGQFLPHIRRPTLILQALDDPFMPADIVPAAQALSASVTLEISDHGGHVGFIGAGPLGTPQAWSEERLSRYVTEAYVAHCGERAEAWVASPA